MKKAVFPGSFDPITKGHESLIRRASSLFDELYVAIGVNQSKTYLFDLNDRIKWIKDTFSDVPNVKVITYSNLTSDLCDDLKVNYIIRGLRNSTDFNYEYSIAQINRNLKQNLETLFLIAEPEFSAISSSIVRDIYVHGGDVKKFIPNAVNL